MLCWAWAWQDWGLHVAEKSEYLHENKPRFGGVFFGGRTGSQRLRTIRTSPTAGGLGELDWCPEPESNRHGGITHRRILSPLCLPVSPSGPLRNDHRILPEPTFPPCRPKMQKAARSGFLREYWRREPESNRPTRICNPVHNRFAIAPMLPANQTRLAETIRGRLSPSPMCLEREKSLELSTSTLARLRSTN